MPREIHVTSVLNKKKQRDAWFLDDYTLNLYSSCSFNCLYCYIRGSKYGLNLETALSVKTNAIEVLDRQLFNRAKKNQYGVIVLSSATDPYVHAEEHYGLTRQALEVIRQHRFPVHLITKSPMIERDFDLLHAIDRTAILPTDLPLQRGAIVTFSFSTIDDRVAKIFEPGAPPPAERLKALQSCVEAGFLSGVSLMPLLPFISDTTESLERLFSTFQKIGAAYVMPSTITLFGNSTSDSKTLVLRAVRKHFPELTEKYERFFASGHEMPAYYKQAFARKMQELSHYYGLPDRIVRAE